MEEEQKKRYEEDLKANKDKQYKLILEMHKMNTVMKNLKEEAVLLNGLLGKRAFIKSKNKDKEVKE